jgi:transcriptional regulator with XRE-family HTH domain
MTRNQRIKEALKSRGIAQTVLADKLGVSHATVNERLNKKEDIDSLTFIFTVRDLTGYNVSWLLDGREPKTGDSPAEKEWIKEYYAEPEQNSKEEQIQYLTGKNIRPVTVVVNQHGKELMTYVPVRAQAGYMKGHGDPHYIEKLPAFSLPILKEGSYRMFEVDGESMLQVGGGGLHDGDIVIAQYLEDILSMRDNRVYVVVSKEGVVVKRCLNRLKEKEPVLVCKSDNKNGQHRDIIIRPHEIIEVWELKAFISKQLSFATDIWQILSDVQVQVALMEEKIKRISDEKLLPG